MRAHVAQSPIGVFAFSDDGKLLHYELYPKDAARVAQKLHEPVPYSFLEALKSYEPEQNAIGQNFLRAQVREYAVSLGFAPDDKEFTQFLHDVGIQFSRNLLGGAIQRDKLLIQAVQHLDETNEILNLFYERLYEWFSLHYPEVKLDKKALAEEIATYGNRKNFPRFSGSLGVDLAPEDETILRSVASTTLQLAQTRHNLEKYIRETTTTLLKNTTALLEPLLVARLLALAGSIEKLSKMPSSTIQLLGAEKALFRHLKKQGKSPKYGILFAAAPIQQAPDALKGKVARILAAKLMIASRVDFYSGRDDTERFRREFNEELQAVMHEKHE